MRKSPIQTLTVVISVTALAGTTTISPAFSGTSPKTSHSKHLRRHQVVHRHHGSPWFAAPPQNSPGDVCPNIGRSFDCKIWPPPMDQDPDRKTGSGDSG